MDSEDFKNIFPSLNVSELVLQEDFSNTPIREGSNVSVAPTGALPMPSDNELYTWASDLKEQLPNYVKIGSRITRRHLLENLAPKILSLNNGIADTRDILRGVLGEEPGIDLIESITNELVVAAVRASLTEFVPKFLGLSEKERALYDQYTAKTVERPKREEKMHSMRELPSVQPSRETKRRGVHRVPLDEGDDQHSGNNRKRRTLPRPK